MACVVNNACNTRHILNVTIAVILVVGIATLLVMNQPLRTVERRTMRRLTPEQYRNKSLDNILWTRLKVVNDELAVVRSRILTERKDINGNSVVDVIAGNSTDLMQRLSAYPQVEAVYMQWLATNGSFVPEKWNALNDNNHNVLVQKYYTWTAEPDLCSQLVSTKGFSNCETSANESTNPVTVQMRFLRLFRIADQHPTAVALKPNSSEDDPDSERFASIFVHAIRNAVVTSDGVVTSGNFKYVPIGCKPDLSDRTPAKASVRNELVEVFVIAQYWGSSVFHEFIEVLPRLVPYLDFLYRNPSVMILIPANGRRLKQFLQMLGLDEERLVSGNVRAEVAYVPQATACGSANLQPIQMLSVLLRNYITADLRHSSQRNKLVLIHRSGRRRFKDNRGVEKVVEKAAADYNLTYTLFLDNPIPSLEETMTIFSDAVMVVATSGAGLSNIVFSEPGTYVIEGVCNPPLVNICFMHLSHVLGHRWHGLMSRGGCEGVVDVAAEAIDRAVRQHLDILKLQSMNSTA